MSVEELEQAVADLSPDELTRFSAWFDRYQQAQEFDEWDRQMKADAEAGKFDDLIQQAREEHRAGKTTRLSRSITQHPVFGITPGSCQKRCSGSLTRSISYSKTIRIVPPFLQENPRRSVVSAGRPGVSGRCYPGKRRGSLVLDRSAGRI